MCCRVYTQCVVSYVCSSMVLFSHVLEAAALLPVPAVHTLPLILCPSAPRTDIERGTSVLYSQGFQGKYLESMPAYLKECFPGMDVKVSRACDASVLQWVPGKQAVFQLVTEVSGSVCLHLMKLLNFLMDFANFSNDFVNILPDL